MDNKTNNKYNPTEIEAKWQEAWESAKVYTPNIEAASSPFYNLMMFPYPSAEGLHVGNMYAFTGADVYGRFKRMQGNEVFEPIGLDGFGIHSENYALKVGRHPKEQAEKSQKNFYRQLKSIGNGFDWTRTLETYDPEYYRWTQWLFITLFKSGLAYRQKAEVNWCPNCKTVLADEQVLQKSKIKNQNSKLEEDINIEVIVKVCERCDTEVELKFLEQWFFRITDYAQRLLDNIETLDWTNKVKIAQKNWIGRSEGAEISFEVVADTLKDTELKPKSSKLQAITVFTTRPDTLYGATFMVISPEHQLAQQVADGKWKMVNGKEVKDYLNRAKLKTDIERTAEGKEKTGVFTGLYVINPINGKKLPIWVADYVLSSYGTGAIMAVPAHDQRDFEFAKKYDLEIVSVIQPKDVSTVDVKMTKPVLGEGRIIGSHSWDGFHVPDEISKTIDDLEKRGIGKRKVNFHLRDWLISRQRYWGPPIPMVHCSNCASLGKNWFESEAGVSYHQEIRNSKFEIRNSEAWNASGWYPVPEDDLPVTLPDVDDWKPLGTGKAPLANHPEFYKTTCPECGGDATRETDVSDTFLDSAWYFLRYVATDLKDMPFPSKKFINPKSEIRNPKQISNSNNKNSNEFRASSLEFSASAQRADWLPVDQYIGGAEHSVLHLLYSRFITMALHDLGYLDFQEPFSKFYAHGLIIKDGAKMSKSKGNVVVPDEYIEKYGADSLRTYLMFLGPYSDGGDFRDSGIEGMNRFLRRVWKFISAQISNSEFLISDESSTTNNQTQKEIDVIMHKTIQGVTDDMENLRYNTAIAKVMEWYNFLNQKSKNKNQKFTKFQLENFLKLLAPFAPHMTEHLYQMLRNSKFEILNSKFTKDESIHLTEWPQFDPSMVLSDTVVIVVQVNGKRRAEIEVRSEKLDLKSEIEQLAKEAASKYLDGTEIKKTIYIPGKIINFVV